VIGWAAMFARAGSRSVKTRATGAVRALCVFHNERTPSLVGWPSGRFLCHGCQATGDAASFVHAFDEAADVEEWWRGFGRDEHPDQLEMF
jgi:hypothetical protein